ncbi:MAG: alpha/beta hydrolase [Alphaproteobacteria bacterium]|nr:alpha/beta hydrolase [Alphaproteobacteria bacterium]
MAERVRVTRHFVTIGRRQVHYRRAGSGPPVVVLHQSPMSSQWAMPHIERFAAEFTVIAPDTPGNGESDPLPIDKPEIADYARALAETLTALGLDRVALFGDHTGACIAAEFARLYPQRTLIAVLEGVVMLPEDERRDLLAHYTPPLFPKWDGSHLVWAWFRLREQIMFFPWFRHTQASRRYRDVKAPAMLQEEVMQLLRAGDHYRNPYDAAFRFHGEKVLAEITAPTHVIVMDFDPITQYLGDLGRLPDAVTIERFGQDRAPMWQRSLDLLRGAAAGAPPAPSVAAAARGQLVADFVDVNGAQLYLRGNDDGTGRPVLLLHDFLQSARCLDRLANGFIGSRPVVAIDLPGHGDSDAGDPSVTAWAAAVDGALAALQIDQADVIGVGGGAPVAVELATTRPQRIAHAVVFDAWHLNDAERADLVRQVVPDLTPRWDGAHLLTAWHAARNQGIFWPWYRQTAGAMLRNAPDVDDLAVHERAMALMRAMPIATAAAQAVVCYPLLECLRASKAVVRCAAAAGGAHAERTRQLADAAGKPFQAVPDSPSEWAAALLKILD